MEFIASLDIQKYKDVTENEIRSEILVLTEKQKQHIINRRGQSFFDTYRRFFPEIATDPDYIFKDNAHNNTAVVSKTIIENGKNINLVIRLAIETDEEGIENSIITAIIENDRRYQQRLRNNEAFYKRNGL